MQISQKTALATHILVCLATFKGQYRLTSAFLAGSTGVNAVIVRNLLLKLQSAGLVTTAAGVGGSELAKSPRSISLLDIYRAVEAEGDLFAFHQNPNPKCPVGRTIAARLTPRFAAAQSALERELGRTRLSDLMKEGNHA